MWSCTACVKLKVLPTDSRGLEASGDQQICKCELIMECCSIIKENADVCANSKSQLQQKPAGISDNKTDVVLYMYTQVCICIENSVGGHEETGDGFVSEERDSRECLHLEAHSRLKT